ncbi:diguanylate cyclase [Candidatus Woesearchaeota archaeon]|nr:diguanylate cyclase [Candidatus Woesearchaeota archaeon]
MSSDSRLERILDNISSDEDREYIKNLIHEDALTKAYNRRKFDNDIILITRMTERTNNGSSFLLIDIDKFKRYNDNISYAKGDEILKKVSSTLKEGLRDYDQLFLYRYGGDEFAVFLFPNGKTEDGKIVAERLRKNIKKKCGVTVSIGVSHYKEATDKMDSLVSYADKAVKQAKQGGDSVSVYK